MSFHLTLQSAPERHGEIAAPSSWTGASTATRTISGFFTGAKTKTYAFTVDGGGELGSAATMNLDWDDGDGNTGTIHIGTDHGYDAGDVRYVHDGFSVALGHGAGTDLVDTDTFTLVCTAANRLRYDHKIIEGDADPVDIALQLTTFDDMDILHTAYDGTSRRTERAILRTPTVALDYQDSDDRFAMLYMKHERHEVTLSENYDQKTTYSFRGGSADQGADGLLPIIGKYATFTRSGIATYEDPKTGLWRSVADGVPRYQFGPETVSMTITAPAAMHQRLRDGRAESTGHAITVAPAATNIVPFFHPIGPPATMLTWMARGGTTPTLSWDSSDPGILDQDDDHWNSLCKGGVCRVDFAAGDDIECVNSFAVAASTTYAYQVWLKGKGTYRLYFMAGNGSASNSRQMQTFVSFNESIWVRLADSATTGATDNTGKLRIEAMNDGVLYLAAKQVEQNNNIKVTGLIQTFGVAQTRNAESLTIDAPLSTIKGSVAFWFWWGADDHSSLYSIVNTTSGGLFRIAFNGSNNQFSFFTDSTGALLGTTTAKMHFYTWNHVAVTWRRDGDGTIARELYVNGVLDGSDTGCSNWTSSWGSTLRFFDPTVAGYDDPAECRLYDLRITGKRLLAEDIADLYNVIDRDEHRHIAAETYGRRFWLANVQEQWLHTSNPDKMLLTAQLVESGREASSLVVRS